MCYNIMLERFKDIASRMFDEEDRLLLAVSGGVDSMVMLNLFYSTDYCFGVAHCNFSLRGEESDGDTKLVEDYCNSRDITLHQIRFDTYAEMARSGDSMQMSARKLRYDWFAKIAREHGYTKIAVAHNSGDTVETFFINLIRGTGVRGMSGIATERDIIVRPIMTFSRCEIERYAVENGVEWRNDSSNNGTKYLRNKLRHIVLPQIQQIEPAFEETMLANMRRVAQSVTFIDSIISQIRDKAFCHYRGRTTISLSVVSQYQPFEYVLYELLSPYGFNSVTVNDIASDIESSRHFQSDGYEALLSRGLFILTPLNRVDSSDNILIEDLTARDGFEFEMVDKCDIKSFKVASNTAFFDADKITFPLTVRSWQDGDTFIPFGMNGHKKLSDYFIDTKVNLAHKQEEKLLVDSSGDIIWLVGRRSDNRYRVTNESKKVLKIVYNG